MSSEVAKPQLQPSEPPPQQQPPLQLLPLPQPQQQLDDAHESPAPRENCLKNCLTATLSKLNKQFWRQCKCSFTFEM